MPDAIRAKSADRLDSWKEIATYLNRSVRSVRRWEQTEQLPVHRHVNVKLGRVFAFTEELDAWRRSRALAPAFVPPSGSEAGSKSRSIAILPFQTRESAENSDTYFAEGLTDEVTTALTRVGQLLVTSRRSAMVSANRAGTTKAVATELGVRYLVEGSVRWSGRRFRVSATLIDAHVDVQRWAESFEGSLEDAFLVQQEIAWRIVAALELQLSPTRRTTSTTSFRCEACPPMNVICMHATTCGDGIATRLTMPYDCCTRQFRSKENTPACTRHSEWLTCSIGRRESI